MDSLATFTLPINTVILPKGFNASEDILQELRPSTWQFISEYSEKELLNFRKTPCCDENGDKTPWVMANPTSNWKGLFQSETPIYGTSYWINYKPHGLLQYLRQHADEYDLIYLQDEVPIFKFHVRQYKEAEAWRVSIDTIWLKRELALQAGQPIVTIQSIFAIHEQCAVCLEDAFLECWGACNHTFCSECITIWRMQGYNTCPLCRAY